MRQLFVACFCPHRTLLPRGGGTVYAARREGWRVFCRCRWEVFVRLTPVKYISETSEFVRLFGLRMRLRQQDSLGHISLGPVRRAFCMAVLWNAGSGMYFSLHGECFIGYSHEEVEVCVMQPLRREVIEFRALTRTASKIQTFVVGTAVLFIFPSSTIAINRK